MRVVVYAMNIQDSTRSRVVELAEMLPLMQPGGRVHLRLSLRYLQASRDLFDLSLPSPYLQGDNRRACLRRAQRERAHVKNAEQTLQDSLDAFKQTFAACKAYAPQKHATSQRRKGLAYFFINGLF